MLFFFYFLDVCSVFSFILYKIVIRFGYYLNSNFRHAVLLLSPSVCMLMLLSVNIANRSNIGFKNCYDYTWSIKTQKRTLCGRISNNFATKSKIDDKVKHFKPALCLWIRVNALSTWNITTYHTLFRFTAKLTEWQIFWSSAQYPWCIFWLFLMWYEVQVDVI